MDNNNYQDSRCLYLEKALADESVAPIDLPFWFLKGITQDFSDSRLIGSGGFGSVYKGALRNGLVAVKKLHNKIEVQEKDFQREIANLIKVKHKNIVRFLGYSYETQHVIYEHQGRHVLADNRNMLFCFEYLSKGNLASYVTDASSGLEWRVRYQIIKGICEGVAHLHERCIIHRDLKPENILLDNTMVPKIADFGISRCFSENQYKIITKKIVGSPGYMPPEFVTSGTITLGTDIYSLGVIISEILTGRKECPNIDMVLESWTNTFGTSKSNPPLEQVKLCAAIGIECMHDDPSRRPDIQDIICRLNTTDITEQAVSLTPPTLDAQLSMELAFGAMASLASKLRKLLMAEYVLEKGLKPNIESLSKELVMMKSSLEDSSQVPPDQLSEVEKQWARQVRERSYDMEDDVDDFILHMVGGGKSAATASDTKVFKKILGKATATMMKFKDRRQISDKVKDNRKLYNELAELCAKYTVRGTGAHLAASSGIDPRVLSPCAYMKVFDLIGIEESRDEVIRTLSIGTKDDADAHAHVSDLDLKIVSIVGVGGLGKTTLARMVHDILKEHFDCYAFISVGRTPCLTRKFENMLVHLDEKYSQVDMSRWDEQRFSNELHKFLQHKRYFIVVDDIWDTESWKEIRYALRDNNCGSRIIMTTRNFDVVTNVEEVYRLKPLSDENSQKLFYKRVQNQKGESLDDVSDELFSKIIDKCGGIPLAIIAIASLLVERPREEWSKTYDSIGFGNAENNTTKILSYSYYDLPFYLKPCLLYLSMFQEDDFLGKNCVIWKWIGEGFVHLENGEGSLYEAGERYFNELVNRSMIQMIGDKFNHFASWFRIHDIVLDLISKFSRDENFVTFLGSIKEHESLDSLGRQEKARMPCSDSKVRRLAIRNHHVQRFLEDTMDMPELLRSFSIVDSNMDIMSPLHSFRFCRMLYIQSSYNRISLKHIGRLLHLKYLEICYTPVGEIPKEIGHLKFLQTLYLKKTGLDELPPAVCLLTQLMCLVAVGFRRLPADRMGNLTSLEYLWLEGVVGRNTTEDLVVALGKLTRLRVVTITFSEELDESMQKGLVQSLCNLRELRELVLSRELEFYSIGSPPLGANAWEDWEAHRQLRKLLIHCILSRLPRSINRSSLPRLCYLSVNVCTVEAQDLDNLARLQELTYLELMTSRTSSWPPGYIVGTDGFRNLRFCHVGTTLKFHMGTMPRLEALQFEVYAGHWSWEQNGVPLEQFPTKDAIKYLDLGLENLLSLEQVSITVNCSGATAAEVQEVEAVVTHAMRNHPNRPTIQMHRIREQNILSDTRRLELLQQYFALGIRVLQYKDKPDAFAITHLRSYPYVVKAVIYINCAGASMHEAEKVEAGFRHAAEVHCNHPTIQLIRTNTDEMVSSFDHPFQPSWYM